METMEITRSHFSGTAVARCRECGWTCVYWEDPEELAHDCTATDFTYHPDIDGTLICSQCDRRLIWDSHDCGDTSCSYAYCPKCLGETSSDCEDAAEEVETVAGLPLWSVDDLKTASLDELCQLFGGK